MREWLAFVLGSLLLVACGDGPKTRRSDEAPLSPEALSRSAERSASARTPAAGDLPADAPLVVFLGDSISAGLHLDPEDAFPAAVQRRLAAEGEPFRLVNAGVSGDTSAGGLRRLDWLLKQAPAVLVLELGGNDGLRGQAPKEIEARLREIIQRARAAGASVLLLGVRLPPSLGPEYVREFDALYGRLAAECDECGYVPFFMEGAAGVPGMMLDDGLHPTKKGHERIAENVAPALSGLLERSQTR